MTGACKKVASDFNLGSSLGGTPVSSTTYNWLVTTSPQYGRKSDDKQKSEIWHQKVRNERCAVE